MYTRWCQMVVSDWSTMTIVIVVSDWSIQVYAWIAVFVLPLNSAINPILYTISTAPFLGNVRKRASRFRKSFISSFTMDNTKHSYVGTFLPSLVSFNTSSLHFCHIATMSYH